MSEHLIYQTQETPLAVALATCGVPFATNEAGKVLPFFNHYNAGLIRQMLDGKGKPRYQGWKLWDAAAHMWKHGLRGRITYNFQRTSLFERLVKIWRGHNKTMSRADELGHDSEILCGAPPEVAMLMFAQYSKNRKMLTESWRKAVPFIEVSGDVRTERHGDKIVVIGSLKAISLNAGPELRAAVGL